uniref:Putative secreted protein n=1 Tax=Anopheles darlingi TaxID=43151 RepID=A0A2M4D8F9_ANODA
MQWLHVVCVAFWHFLHCDLHLSCKIASRIYRSVRTLAENNATTVVIRFIFVLQFIGCCLRRRKIDETRTLVGSHLQYTIVERLPALDRWEEHLEVVRVLLYVEVSAAFVALVQADRFDLVGLKVKIM